MGLWAEVNWGKLHQINMYVKVAEKIVTKTAGLFV